jgi:hypothetical protein
MKAQLSLEFLIVFAVFLAVLLLAVTAIGKISRAGDAAQAKAFCQLALSDIVSSANEACVLGDGNVRVAGMPAQEVALSFSGREISATCGSWSGSETIKCDVSGEAMRTVGGNVTIENRGGTLYFS